MAWSELPSAPQRNHSGDYRGGECRGAAESVTRGALGGHRVLSSLTDDAPPLPGAAEAMTEAP